MIERKKIKEENEWHDKKEKNRRSKSMKEQIRMKNKNITSEKKSNKMAK